MRHHAPYSILVNCICLALPLLILGQRDDPARYLRLAVDDAGLQLELAARTFLAPRDGGAPAIVTLVGVSHVAEAGYYRVLQQLLDEHDLVLFEQVRPRPPWDDLDALEPGERAAVLATARRLELVLAEAAGSARTRGRAPASVEALLRSVQLPSARERLARAARDVWGGPVELEASLERGTFRGSARSLGADGAEGGDGAAADREVELTLERGALGPGEGIQEDLAAALGLAFQLDAIDYGAVHWRNSDIALEDLAARLELGGEGSQALLGALDGSSILGRLGGGLLRLLAALPGGRASLKLVAIEALARSEDIFAAPPREFAELFRILIEERNAIVVHDLRAVLAAQEGGGRVAVFYGAGHMATLDEVLRAELGLRPLDTRWLPAIALVWDELDVPRDQAERLRSTIRSALERELGKR